ncbi:hypothetical protein HPB48_003538 [Haemaphysalis longicornis]|uniref:Uncharacterized protein n=1 Tax=Haemaphysalis longicornis TaxID=44386 RepID=A0A9J6GJW9_HAELO|nr:hypothetical protein HPB48_003538 [Haemaphysalis longicornis]
MPTNAELEKMVADMQQRLDAETERTAEAVFGRFLLKMQTSGVDIVELKKQVDELVSSLEHMNSLVEDLRSSATYLVLHGKIYAWERPLDGRNEDFRVLNSVGLKLEFEAVPLAEFLAKTLKRAKAPNLS